MFGNLIYYNKKKVDQYSTLILGHAADWESAEKVDNDNKCLFRKNTRVRNAETLSSF